MEWLSKKECSFCGKDMTKEPVFYDGATVPFGQWALMCVPCWKEHGIDGVDGLTLKYELQKDGRHLRRK